MADITLSPIQKQVTEAIIDWFKAGKKPYLTLGGYAGTGKTTLIAHLRELLLKEHKDLKIAFCSYTGKATRVLSDALGQFGTVKKGDRISTIHSLIYSPIEDSRGRIIGWKKKEPHDIQQKLIVIDEASMISREIWDDLLSFNIPILAVGDHGQLPPIGGKFNLMEEPELLLEEIHRQEAGNPIIRVSMLARRRGKLPHGIFGKKVKKFDRANSDTQEFLGELLAGFSDEMMVLTGYNSTRVKLNGGIRQLLGFETPSPTVRDRVICLRNNHLYKIYNGMMGTIDSIEHVSEEGKEFYRADILFDGEDKVINLPISTEQFGELSRFMDERRDGVELFDFGYALTVHKAQGSQAKVVVVFEERFPKMDDDMWRRWLYTAVTRAREELYIVG